MTPKRIQRKRTKGWRMPEGAIYVGRPTIFGNPFAGRDAVAHYRRWLSGKMGCAEFHRLNTNRPWCLRHDRERILETLPPLLRRFGSMLRGKDLACWCPLDQPCHADVLLELANADEKERGI